MQIPRPKALSEPWQALKRHLLQGREGGRDRGLLCKNHPQVAFLLTNPGDTLT